MGKSPCDKCAHIAHCAKFQTACHAYVAFSRDFDWDDRPRTPNRIDYLRATEDLRVMACIDIIARVRREARAAGRKLTLAEVASALNVDEAAALELIERYRAKQGMTRELVE